MVLQNNFFVASHLTYGVLSSGLFSLIQTKFTLLDHCLNQEARAKCEEKEEAASDSIRLCCYLVCISAENIISNCKSNLNQQPVMENKAEW